MKPSKSLLPTLMPSVRALSRADKLRLIEVLKEELALEDAGLKHGAVFEIWTPLFAHEAAAILQRELEKQMGRVALETKP